ncbi:MAG: enoyl-CoA hydratase-related protein [Burkholderiales bacterium]
MSDRILTDRPAPHVARVRIHWPEKRNALSVALRHELIAALQSFDDDDDVRAIVIAGGEKVFASGADLTEILNASAIDMMLRATERLWAAIGRTGKPMVAAVRGLALGGGFELALHADMIVAGEGTRLGLPEVKLGLMPGGGGTQRLLRLVGRHRALQLLMTGDTLTAREAERLGVVNVVAPDDQVDQQAIALAARVAAMPPLAIRQIREVVARGADCSLDTALMLESKALQLLCASHDKHEGIEALLDKRAPNFTGR